MTPGWMIWLAGHWWVVTITLIVALATIIGVLLLRGWDR